MQTPEHTVELETHSVVCATFKSNSNKKDIFIKLYSAGIAFVCKHGFKMQIPAVGVISQYDFFYHR
jgi:hypothetical protein